METLRNGSSYNNREIVLEKTKSHYLASGRPIFDGTGRIIGAVSVLKDISEVREMVQSVTGQPPDAFGRILHESTGMKRVIAMARTIARGDSTVLIRGETGTGKEVFARAIHEASPRCTKVFVPINCAAIPDHLLESELFGYEEGAFHRSGPRRKKRDCSNMLPAGRSCLTRLPNFRVRFRQNCCGHCRMAKFAVLAAVGKFPWMSGSWLRRTETWRS